ncbi:MAG: sodium-dependent transporter [Burkholderiales bacterium]|nr:sodium-dependent transporter [Burkholderiales bacterium]
MIRNAGARRAHWSSRWAFILAATGSAVGLGNIWKFPYMAGESGGGAFVLIYLVCIAAIGLPLLMAEIMLGRRAQRNPVDAMAVLAREAGASAAWRALGVTGVITGLLILSFYSVVAGWMLDYLVLGAGGGFAGLDSAAAQSRLSALLADPQRMLLWHSVFMLMTAAIVGGGVAHGLERANKLLMPALFAILLFLLVYGLIWGEAGRAAAFLFHADFAKITPGVTLAAMGQAFFSLSLGMGSMMVYGSYLKRDTSIVRASVAVAAMDTVVALLAGLAIFSIVFAHHLEPAAGPGLVLQTLPIAFGDMAGGALIGSLFFVLLVFAAWTSSIALLEPATAWITENTRLTRPRASALLGTAAWLLGVAVVLSFNAWRGVTLFGLGIFDALDYLSSNILLPLGGVLIAVFAAWVMKAGHSRQELNLDATLYAVWRLTLRYVVPLAIVLIFLQLTGLLPRLT